MVEPSIFDFLENAMTSSSALDESALRAALALAASVGAAPAGFGRGLAMFGLGDEEAFEQALALAAQAGSGQAGRAAVGELLDRFVRRISPASPIKARRFLQLLDCPGFGPNLRLAIMPEALPEGSGLAQPTVRPLEFAIDQFLASRASPAWAQAILALADHPAFDGALDRRLAFSVVQATTPNIGGGDIIQRSLVPAFAANFLMREAGNLPSEASAPIARLVGAIERRMGERAKREMMAERDALRYLGSFFDSPQGEAESRAEAARDIRPRKRP